VAQRPPEKRVQQVVRQEQRLEVHSGPLPPVSDFSGYDQIVPGAAERILVMAESEISHRHEQERKSLDADIKANRSILFERKLGQSMAFVVAMSALGIGGFLVYGGHPVAGTIFGGFGLAPVVWAFVPKKSSDIRLNNQPTKPIARSS
jgi:uncharacterized membrane protein